MGSFHLFTKYIILLFLYKDGHWWQQRSFITKDGLEQKCVKIDTKTARQWFMRSKPLKPRPTGGQNTTVIRPETENGDTNHNTVAGAWNKQTILETKTTQEVSSDSGTCSNSSSSCLWSCTSSSSPSASSGSNSTDVSPQSQQEDEYEKRKRRSGYFHQHKDESSSSQTSTSASPSPVSQPPSRRVYSVADADPNVSAILQIDADGNVGVIVAEINDKVNEKTVITGNEELRSQENRGSFLEANTGVIVAEKNDKLNEKNVVTGNEELRSQEKRGSFSEPNIGVIVAETNGKVNEKNVITGNEELRSKGNTESFSEPTTVISKEHNGTSSECSIDEHENTSKNRHETLTIEEKVTTTCEEAALDDCTLSGHQVIPSEVKISTHCVAASSDVIAREVQVFNNTSSEIFIQDKHPLHLDTICDNASSSVMTKGGQAELGDVFHPETDIFSLNNGFSRRKIAASQDEMFDGGIKQNVSEVKTGVSSSQEPPTVEFSFCPEAFVLFSSAEGFNDPIDHELNTIELPDSPGKSSNSFIPDVIGVFSSEKITDVRPSIENTTCTTIGLPDSPDKSSNSFIPDVFGVFSSDKITDVLPSIENTTCTTPNVKLEEQPDRIAIDTPVRKLNMSISSNSTSSGWSPEYESGLSCTDDIEVVVIDLNSSPEFKKDATGTRDTNKETKAKLLASDTELVKNGQVAADAESNVGGKPGEVCVKCEGVNNVQDCFESENKKVETKTSCKNVRELPSCAEPENKKVETKTSCKNVRELPSCAEPENKKVETKASCKNVRELPSCAEPESEKVDTKAMCEEVRNPNGCAELSRNITSTPARKDLSAKLLESPGEGIGPEMQKEEGPKDINEHLRLQMLSDKKNGVTEAFGGTSHLKTDFNDIGKSFDKGQNKLKTPSMQAFLLEPAVKLKAAVTREKSASSQQGSYLKTKGAQVQPGLRQAKTTHLPQRKVFVNSLPTKKLQVDEKTKGSLPGLTLQQKSLNPNRVDRTLQEKKKDKSSVTITPEDVATKAKRLTCTVKPVNCQLKTKAEVKQSDSLKGQTCSQKKEKNRPVIRTLKRESKQQVDTKIENIKKVETVQSDQKQRKKHEDVQQQEEIFKEEQEIVSSRRDEKEMNYLNHHAKLERNVEGNGKKQEKNNKAVESPIPIHNLAKLLQSASKIPESENIEQKSKGNSQVHNRNKLVPPPAKLPTSPSAVSTQLIKCDKVAKVKTEMEKQPSKHAKNDTKKDAEETKTDKRALNIEIVPQTSIPVIRTQQFVGKAGIYVMSKSKSRATCIQSSGTSGPFPVSVSNSSEILLPTKIHQIRTQNSKVHATRPTLLKKENQMQKSPKQEPKPTVSIKKCSTKVQIPPAKLPKTPPNSINKDKSTEELQRPTKTDYKSSGNKINSQGTTGNEKTEMKSPSLLQKFLTRVWNFSTKFRKSSTDVEEQQSPETAIKSPEKAEEKLTNSIQQNTSKYFKGQDGLKHSRKLSKSSIAAERLPVDDQQLVNMNRKSSLDVVKCSTETQPTPVAKCEQPEKEDPGVVLLSSARELQKDDRESVQSTGKQQYANGMDPFISNNDKTDCAIEKRRGGISCVETSGTKPKLQNNSESESCKATLTNRPSVVCKTSRDPTNNLNINKNESMNSLTKKSVEKKENDTNEPGERNHGMRCNLLAQMLTESSSSEPESSYTDSFETLDSSFEDIEHNNPSGIKKTGATQAKYIPELIYEMSDDLSVFTDQKETYKMMFGKKEIKVNKRTQNELCPGVFHLKFGKTTAKISNVILSKSPGELKSIDAMYNGHLKFPTKLHCTSRKSERLAFLETEEGNYDVAMCSIYPSDKEMKKKLNKVSGSCFPNVPNEFFPRRGEEVSSVQIYRHF